MKFILEILFLVVLFLLLRKAIRAMFPPAEVTVKLSRESRQEVRAYHRRYLLLFTGLGLFLSLLSALALRLSFDFYHAYGQYEISYAIENLPLILPAVIIGFLLANFMADQLNEQLQNDGLGFFLRELQADFQGLDVARLKKWHIAAVIIFTAIFIYNQSQVYFKIKDNKVLYSTQISDNNSAALDDVSHLLVGDNLQLIFNNKDTLNLGQYNYDEEEIKQFFKNKIKTENP